MKRLSLQWRITIMTALLTCAACVLTNCLVGYTGMRYMDAIGSDISALSAAGVDAPQAFDQNEQAKDISKRHERPLSQLEEQSKANGTKGRSDNPKTDDNLGLGPALLFEMMMDGRHKEDALVRKVEIDNLNHDRQGLNDKQAADDEGDDLGVGHDGRAGKRGAQGKRAGIAHKDARRIAVEPQKAQAGTGTRGAEDGQVHVSVQKRHGSHGEHGDHGGAASKTVKAIGQVHGIRKTGDHQPAKDNVEPRERKAADGGRKNTEVNRQAAGKTNLGGDAAPVDGKYRKGDTDNG